MTKNNEVLEPKTQHDFFQIRIAPRLKSEFMQQCHEQSLNPSAVVRKLMSDWASAKAGRTPGSSPRKASP